MPKYLVTGVAGAGKTAVINELASKGFTAYSTDELPEVTQLEDLQTGEFIKKSDTPIDFSKYGWNWQKHGLNKLLSNSDTVFIAASVSNMHEFCQLFDKIFVLTLDESTLRKRLAARFKDDNYGKHPEDLARIIDVLESEKRRLIEHDDAIIVDAAQPLEQVVDKILADVKAGAIA